jgi:hypothetical protein
MNIVADPVSRRRQDRVARPPHEGARQHDHGEHRQRDRQADANPPVDERRHLPEAQRDERRPPALDGEKRRGRVDGHVGAVHEPRPEDDRIDHHRRNHRHGDGRQPSLAPEVGARLQQQRQQEQGGDDADRRVDHAAQRVHREPEEQTDTVAGARAPSGPDHEAVIQHGKQQRDAENLQALDPGQQARLAQAQRGAGGRHRGIDAGGPEQQVGVGERDEQQQPAHHLEHVDVAEAGQRAQRQGQQRVAEEGLRGAKLRAIGIEDRGVVEARGIGQQLVDAIGDEQAGQRGVELVGRRHEHRLVAVRERRDEKRDERQEEEDARKLHVRGGESGAVHPGPHYTYTLRASRDDRCGRGRYLRKM